MRPAAARSRLYGLLGECLTYPDAEFVSAVCDGTLATLVRSLCEAIDPGLSDNLDLAILHDPAAGLEALAVEYTRLFDAGRHGTHCSLNGGLQVGSQMTVMEEAVRFYNHFGLSLAEDRKELPDHLTTQLEFLHFLSTAEQMRVERGEPGTAWELAQRDFIARHPGRWVPVMREKLAALEPLPIFSCLTGLVAQLLAHELHRLEAVHGAASLKVSGELPFGGA